MFDNEYLILYLFCFYFCLVDFVKQQVIRYYDRQYQDYKTDNKPYYKYKMDEKKIIINLIEKEYYLKQHELRTAETHYEIIVPIPPSINLPIKELTFYFHELSHPEFNIQLLNMLLTFHYIEEPYYFGECVSKIYKDLRNVIYQLSNFLTIKDPSPPELFTKQNRYFYFNLTNLSDAEFNALEMDGNVEFLIKSWAHIQQEVMINQIVAFEIIFFFFFCFQFKFELFLLLLMFVYRLVHIVNIIIMLLIIMQHMRIQKCIH
jgi:hypothetical protein